jgi:hypothetical protein
MDADEFVQFISPWIDVCAHFYSNGDEMRRNSPASPTEGEVPSVSDIQLVDERVSGHARDAILSFAVNAALGGRIDALHTLRTALANLSLPGDGPAMLKRMLRPDDAPPDDTKVDYICSAVHSVLKHPALSHDQLFSVTLRLVQALYGSAFRYALEDQVVRWVKRNWRSALEARFGFKSPNVFTPAIAAALDVDGLAGVAAVLLAAEPALNVRVSPDFRRWLRTVS